MTTNSIQNPLVSIQGYKGSFHHIAAKKLLGENCGILEREFFDQVFKDVDSGTVTYGVVAVKNSLYGDISECVSLFPLFPDIKVIQEIDLFIEQNLIIIPGTKLEELTEVQSQLPALGQCLKFLEQHPKLKQVETNDTALSVRNMMEKKEKNVATIGSALAAEIYHAEILVPSIQDSKENVTSFVLIIKK